MHTATVRITIGERALDLTYRVYSSDRAIIQQTFQQEDGALHRLKRWPEIQDWLSRQTKAPLILDCGAYIGTTALYYETMFPTAKVVAVEPDAENFALLKHNTQGTRIETVQAAVFGKNIQQVRIERDADHASRHRAFAGEGVSALTIDTLYAANRDAAPFMVKLDIEGSEFDVFKDPCDWIDHTPIIVMEPHDWLYPKQGLTESFLFAMAGRPRDFIISGEYIISIAHELP